MRVAVVGATGVVGSTILEVMRERSSPADEVVPFASERSAGKTIDYGGRALDVQTLSEETIQGFDLALFSAGETAREWAPRFAAAGAVVVDNSSVAHACQRAAGGLGGEPGGLARHGGIVANPNCSTMQMASR